MKKLILVTAMLASISAFGLECKAFNTETGSKVLMDLQDGATGIDNGNFHFDATIVGIDPVQSNNLLELQIFDKRAPSQVTKLVLSIPAYGVAWAVLNATASISCKI